VDDQLIVKRDKVSQGDFILVIDDELDARELLTRMLEKEGFNVVAVSSGEEALELARKYQPF